MKLNEYIRYELVNRLVEHDDIKTVPLASTVEDWIIDWYKKTYRRMPPTWLANNICLTHAEDEK